MDEQQPPVTPESTTEQPQPTTSDPVGQTPEQIETQPQTERQIETPTPESAPQATETVQETPVATDPQPEVLLKDFLDGKSIAFHKPIHIELAPLTVKQVEGGGIIITPSSNLLVKYKDQ